MTPTITSAEMRDRLDDPDIDYILLCNKICGASHYNMWIPVIVETQAEYDAWMTEQTPFTASTETEESEPEGAELEVAESTNDNK
jgi:cytochrome c oxidase subunit 2